MRGLVTFTGKLHFGGGFAFKAAVLSVKGRYFVVRRFKIA
jgi:hypothetical protein